jgi:hypothetical protein
MGYQKTSQAQSYWLCRCICENWNIVAKGKLKSGKTKSCGCHKDQAVGDRNRTHGLSRSRSHNIWCGIHSRCYDPNSQSYEGYGGRGIIVCERWHGPNGFANFLLDMGEPPSQEYSLDRKNNDGPYSPENCKWSDRYEQARNTRRNRYLTAQDQTYCISQWSEITGLKQGLIAARVRRGWSDEEALEFKERIHRKPLKTKWLRANSPFQ